MNGEWTKMFKMTEYFACCTDCAKDMIMREYYVVMFVYSYTIVNTDRRIKNYDVTWSAVA